VQEVESEEARLARSRAIKARMDAARRRATREAWEMFEEDVGSGEEEGVGESQAAREDGTVKGQSRPKTSKEKRKRRLNKLLQVCLLGPFRFHCLLCHADRLPVLLQANAKAKKAVEVAQRRTIATLPTVVSSLSSAELSSLSERTRRRAERAAKLAANGLTSLYSGPSRVPRPKVDVQLSEELPESLRDLRPEGSLWKDWENSAIRRGKIPAKRQTAAKEAKAKGRREREVEKYAWKNFERST
jgi:nucleolar protein 53